MISDWFDILDWSDIGLKSSISDISDIKSISHSKGLVIQGFVRVPIVSIYWEICLLNKLFSSYRAIFFTTKSTINYHLYFYRHRKITNMKPWRQDNLFWKLVHESWDIQYRSVDTCYFDRLSTRPFQHLKIPHTTDETNGEIDFI
jgi:hypothetical protein